MYPVTQDYKNKIRENNRLFECKIQIEHSQGTLYLSDKDLVTGTLVYTESSQAGEEFTIGSTVASDISFTILNKPEYENIVFTGATVFVNIGLQVQEGTDAHFLQPSQPSKMKGYEEKWEYVPLGRFNIDDVNRQRNTIQLKAIDNMINLDKPYSLSKLSYPATLYQIYVNVCNVADIPVGTTNFPNKDYVVKVRPDDDLTLRDVLGYVAELSGTFAKCNRNGALELKWYEQTDITLDPNNRFNFKPSDDVIQIKGVMATVEDKTYLTGTDDYAIDLTENPLLQGGYETVLRNIFNNVKDTVFTPYTSNWQGNPALQAGDMITQIDRDGKIYNTLVTKSTYKYRGRSILEGRGLPEISRGYKGSTNRKLAQIKRKIDEEVGDKITDLEQAMLEATELITGQLGGYVLKRENELLIMDNPDPDKAVKIWRWNLAGLGYSNSGINGPYGLAMTMNGAINANFITTGLLSANLVKTGLLQSRNGKVWMDLDNNTFNLGEALYWDGTQLTLKSSSIPDEFDPKYLEDDINNIKNLKPGTLKGGITTINNERVRVEHGSTNQYSEIRADGFIRKYPYGEAAYLNDIHVITSLASSNDWASPNLIRVTLPQRFFDRGDDIKVLLFLKGFETSHLSLYERYLRKISLHLEIVKIETIALNPWVDLYAYVKIEFVDETTGEREFKYRDVDFDLMVIGY